MDGIENVIRQAFEEYLDGAINTDSTMFGYHYETERKGNKTGYKNMAQGFYAGYMAALFATDKVKTAKWIDIKERLPGIDEYVLWIHENGFVFEESIDKDWDKEYLDYFLGGYGHKETSGAVTHWMPIPKIEI